jgi:hypothetical protein
MRRKTVRLYLTALLRLQESRVKFINCCLTKIERQSGITIVESDDEI